MLAGPENPSDGGAWSHAGWEQPSVAPSMPSQPTPVVDEAWPPGDPRQAAFDAGFLVGVLVGEGHFGGDGRQPQVTLRMHADHAALFRWLMERLPGSRLYGPYEHSGRRYYQWMARGRSCAMSCCPSCADTFAPSTVGAPGGDTRPWSCATALPASNPSLRPAPTSPFSRDAPRARSARRTVATGLVLSGWTPPSLAPVVFRPLARSIGRREPLGPSSILAGRRFRQVIASPSLALLAVVNRISTVLDEHPGLSRGGHPGGHHRIERADPADGRRRRARPSLRRGLGLAMALGFEHAMVWAFVGGLLLDLLMPERAIGSTTLALLLVTARRSSSHVPRGPAPGRHRRHRIHPDAPLPGLLLALLAVTAGVACRPLMPVLLAVAIANAIIAVVAAVLLRALDLRFGEPERTAW